MISYRKKKILFVCPYPIAKAPSQRFRFEQYFESVEKIGFKIKTNSFLDIKSWEILYRQGNNLQKAVALISGFISRFSAVIQALNYDYIFIHREASPLGPPIFEYLIAKILKKKIIYDFDDAIWLPNTSKENSIAAHLKWHSKVKDICKWSYKVSCGNKYLCDYARQVNCKVVLNPTTIDTENLHSALKDQNTSTVVVGWTGTHSTLIYLEEIIPVLTSLKKQYDFEFLVICNKKPDLPLPFIYKKWNKDSEIDDLLDMNVGIMPLTDDEWSKGKCGFKALQYMALGIPALVSPVGVNQEIVDHEENGFICRNDDEWINHLSILIKDCEMRKEMGLKAKEKVEKEYSVKSNKENFLSLFE